MTKRRKQALIGAGLTVVGLAFVLRQHMAVEKVDVVTQVTRNTEKADEVFAKREVASVSSKVVSVVESVKAQAPNYSYSQDLNRYGALKLKVFLTPAEKVERLELLKNPAVLKELGQRLLHPVLADEDKKTQNLALTMLLDAAKDGDHGAAAEVMTTVVADKQVEDEHLAQDLRQDLAGLKADLLYRWTAAEPERAGELEGRLPGPVSQKIWRNVQEAQASNRAESSNLENH